MPDGWELIVAAFALGFAAIAAPLVLVSRLKRDRWAGRRVVTKRVGVPYGRRNPDGTFTAAGVLDSPLVEVAGRRGDWLRVGAPGSDAWVALADVVPLEDAPAYFEEHLRAHPGDARAWGLRGIAWDALGQADRALTDYDEAVRLDPADSGTLFNRANAWLARGDHDRAVADYTAAFEKNPAFVAAVYNRGRVWMIRQEPDKALADFSEAIRLAPTWALAYLGRGNLRYTLQQFDQAVADYTEGIRLAPADPACYAARAHAWLLQAELDRALADFNDALRLGSTNAADHVGRAKVWYAKLAYDRAEADCTAALRLDPDHADAFLTRGLARGAMKNPVKKRVLAPADFEMAARRVPEGAYRCFCRALSWGAQKEYGKAHAELAEALRQEPANYAVLALFAWLHATCPDAACRDGTKAVEYATRAWDATGGKQPRLLAVLAAAHAEAGDFARALEYQKRFLASPDLPEEIPAEFHEQLVCYEQGKPYRDP